MFLGPRAESCQGTKEEAEEEKKVKKQLSSNIRFVHVAVARVVPVVGMAGEDELG